MMLLRSNSPTIFAIILALVTIFVCCFAYTSLAQQASDTGQLPAVSGLNGKFVLEGSTEDNFMFKGSLTMPLGPRVGFQLDGEIGNYMNERLGGVGAHLFTRDPDAYLLGVYGSAHNWNDISIFRFAAEAEIYSGRFSFTGLAGIERTDVPKTQGGLIVVNKDESIPFGLMEFSYYPTDNLRLSGGYAHENKQDFATVGVETQIIGTKIPTSFYANARSNFKGYDSVHAGIKFYLGANPDKTLIRRHREDDPQSYTPTFPTLITKAPETEPGTATDCASIVQSYEASLPDAGGGACDGSVYSGQRYKVGSCGSCSLNAAEVHNGFSYTPITTSVNINQCTAQVSGCPLRNTINACDSGPKQCRDGSLVVRNPNNGCAFNACPGEGL